MLKNVFWLLVGCFLLFVFLPVDMGWMGDRVADFDSYKWVPIDLFCGLAMVSRGVMGFRKK